MEASGWLEQIVLLYIDYKLADEQGGRDSNMSRWT